MKINYEFLSEEMILSQQNLEEIILGEILIDQESIHIIGAEFESFLFHDKAHQKIANALIEIFKNNEIIDLISITKKLMQNNTLQDIGGAIKISSLTSQVSSSNNLQKHFRLLQENYLRRFVVKTNNDTNGQALDFSNDIFDTIESQINTYTETLNGLISNKIDSVGIIHNELLKQHILFSDGKKLSGVPTNLKLLDNLTNGFQKSDLIILAGRTAMGKTSCAIVFALNPAIIHNIPIAIFSLEMSKEQLVSRMQSILSKINVSKIVKKQLNGAEIIELDETTKALNSAPIFIDDTAGMSLTELKTKSRKLVRENNVQMIIVDYLQLLRSGSKNQSREQEVAEISRSLKNLAKELKVPVIALSQLSRQVEMRGNDKKPQLSDLRESGQIEQDADMVIFCYRPEYYELSQYEINDRLYDSKGLFLLLISKHRNGSLGDIPLEFIPENTNIVDNKLFLPKTYETILENAHKKSFLSPFSSFEFENSNEDSFF